MKYLLLTLALLGDPSGVSATPATQTAAPSPLPAATVQEIASAVRTGSILASQGDCLAVRVYSLSSYTHVGTVVMQDGQPYVYDTVPGPGVRRQTLRDYLISQQPCDLQLLHPVREFTPQQTADFEKHLRSQLGRPYDVKHYATGRRCNGLHCSEYVTDALVACQRIESSNPAAVSPGELIECLTEHQLYAAGTTHILPEPPRPPAPESTTWYGRAWQGTKSCSYDCWVQTRRWFCCK